MSYTQRFTEGAALLAAINPASYNSVQDTGFVSLANYQRAVIIIHAGVLGGDLDIDIEQGTDTSGTGVKTLNAGGKDVTKTGTTDNNTVTVIEIKTSELDVANAFDTINAELTPASAGIFSVQIWGIVANYPPVGTTLIDEIVD